MQTGFFECYHLQALTAITGDAREPRFSQQLGYRIVLMNVHRAVNRKERSAVQVDGHMTGVSCDLHSTWLGGSLPPTRARFQPSISQPSGKLQDKIALGG